jgi:hypothetical protein
MNLFQLLDEAHTLWYSKDSTEFVNHNYDDLKLHKLSQVPFSLSFIHQICNMRTNAGEMRYHESFQNYMQRFVPNPALKEVSKMDKLLIDALIMLNE